MRSHCETTPFTAAGASGSAASATAPRRLTTCLMPIGSCSKWSNFQISVIIIVGFIHSGHFYSATSSPLLLIGAPDYSTDTVWEFHTEAHRQLQVKDLPKVTTWG